MYFINNNVGENEQVQLGLLLFEYGFVINEKPTVYQGSIIYLSFDGDYYEKWYCAKVGYAIL